MLGAWLRYPSLRHRLCLIFTMRIRKKKLLSLKLIKNLKRCLLIDKDYLFLMKRDGKKTRDASTLRREMPKLKNKKKIKLRSKWN